MSGTTLTPVITDAVCKPNGSTNAFGAYRIYFGTDDPRNVQVLPLVPADPPHTNNRVHLMAIKEAIDRSLQLTKRKTIVIMTTSKYAARKRT